MKIKASLKSVFELTKASGSLWALKQQPSPGNVENDPQFLGLSFLDLTELSSVL